MKKEFSQDNENKGKKTKRTIAALLVLFLLCGTTLYTVKSKQVKLTGPTEGDVAIIDEEEPALAASVEDAAPVEEPVMGVDLPAPEEVEEMGAAVNDDAENQNIEDGQNQQVEVTTQNLPAVDPTVAITDDPVALQQSVAQLATDLQVVNAQLVAATTTTTGGTGSNNTTVTEVTNNITQISEVAQQAATALAGNEAALEAAQAKLTEAQAAYNKKVAEAQTALKTAQDAALAASNVKYAAMQALIEMTTSKNEDAYSQEILEKLGQTTTDLKRQTLQQVILQTKV